MQTQRSFIDDLKHQYNSGGMYIRLIFINVAIFLLINIVLVFGSLAGFELETSNILRLIFGLETSFSGFITHPWGLFTSIFAHFGFLHLLFNMVFLYFSGRYFEQVFSGKRLIYTYVIGGIAGGIFEILAQNLFPGLDSSNVVVVGASGSIMAIFMAVAFNQPNLQIRLFTLPPFKIIWLAVIYLVAEFISLAANDGTAHFAHLGGALIGIASVRHLQTSSNIITIAMSFGDSIKRLFSGGGRRKIKVVKGDKVRYMSDEDYNQNAKERQKETDRILDKISKSGYDSLSKREKEFLFNQSKND